MPSGREGSWVRTGSCHNIKQNLHQGQRPKVWGVPGMVWKQETSGQKERKYEQKVGDEASRDQMSDPTGPPLACPFC